MSYSDEVRQAMRTKLCSSCKKPIVFLRTGLGKLVPCEAASVKVEDVRFRFERGHRPHRCGKR